MKVFKFNADAVIPTRGSAGSAGYDLYSTHGGEIPPKSRGIVSTGIGIVLPNNTYGRIAPRSSLAWRSGVDVGAGVVDSDYRGEIKVMLFNHSDSTFYYSKGDRVAQLIVTKIESPDITEIALDDANNTVRGSGGFGSTGK